jgi:hypothetical protein
MKSKEAFAFSSDWECKQAQREERKQDKSRRAQRRGRKNQWQAKGVDE